VLLVGGLGAASIGGGGAKLGKGIVFWSGFGSYGRRELREFYMVY